MADVRENAEANRIEIVADDGNVAGFVLYLKDGEVYDLVHTEVGDAYEGQGMGGKLARGALDAVRAAGGRVVATCPFIKGWIDKHEDYQDLLAA